MGNKLSEARRKRTDYLRRKAENHALLAELRKKPCTDCNKTFPDECMEFDHCRDKKLFTLGSCSDRSLARMLTEVAKCDLVCANCHRIREAKRRRKRGRRDY